MNHFVAKDNSHSAEQIRQRKWFIKARDERQKQRELEEAQDSAFINLATSTIIATEIQIAEFREKLDRYDEATVRALQLNQRKIENVELLLLDVRNSLQEMLDRTHTLDDGRRVFLTEDRSRAFDEFGSEVTREELDFDIVSETAPTWESYKELRQQETDLSDTLQSLEQERSEILQFQTKLDDAREEFSGSEITERQLEELDADLDVLMPVSVKQKLPGYELSAPVPSATAQFKFSADPSSFQKLRTSTADLRLERF